MTVRIDGTNSTANPAITGADTDTGLQLGTDEIQFVTGGTNRATVESNGNLTIEDGNLVVADGHGIDFSATGSGTGTMTSELLDDYEEGTWTPEFSSNNTTPPSVTYETQAGSYVKIGRQVTCFFDLEINDVASAGNGSFIVVRGAPFNYAAATAAGKFSGNGGIRVNQINSSAVEKTLSLEARSSSSGSDFILINNNDNSNATAIGPASLTDNTRVLGTLIYFTA